MGKKTVDTRADLVKYLCAKEGKKVGVPVGQMREVVAILSDLCYEQPGVCLLLQANGRRRATRGRK